MGIFLVMTNISISMLALWLGWARFKKDRRKKQLRNAKASNVESAAAFTADKFKTTFDAIAQTQVPASHALLYHYTSLRLARMATASGMPALEKYSGVAFSLRRPHELTTSERLAFSADEKEPSNVGPIPGCPFEAVLVISLPKRLLDPLPRFEDDPCMCSMPVSVLKAMRPTSFTGVLKSIPWLQGFVLLSPSCLIRRYSLIDEDAFNDADDSTEQYDLSMDSTMDWVREDDEMTLAKEVSLIRPASSVEFLVNMRELRSHAEDLSLIPLFHYTSHSVAALILEGGLRMSTVGQGDGGVYFSTLGPASMGLGKVCGAC